MWDRFYPFYCGAGRGARAKYRADSRRWRSRIFRRPWLIAAVLITPVLAVAGWEHNHIWLLLFGLALGALVGVYAVLLDSPPAHIENWRTGFESERRTARELAPLRRHGYVLLHDLPDRHTSKYKGNVDHVVVSTGGVFLLDTKSLGGEVTIKGNTVHVQRRDSNDDAYELPWLVRGMLARARRLEEDIDQQADVRPVAVFWNSFDASLVARKDIVFVHGDRLVAWLEAQTREMTPAWVAHVATCIKQARPPEHPAWWTPVHMLRRHPRSVGPPPSGSTAPTGSSPGLEVGSPHG